MKYKFASAGCYMQQTFFPTASAVLRPQRNPSPFVRLCRFFKTGSSWLWIGISLFADLVLPPALATSKHTLSEITAEFTNSVGNHCLR